MAVGDIVNFMANASTTFQPAAGVEIMVLKTFANASATSSGITDGTNSAVGYVSSSVPYQAMETSNRFGITNSSYFTINSGSLRGMSGIQIK